MVIVVSWRCLLKGPIVSFIIISALLRIAVEMSFRLIGSSVENLKEWSVLTRNDTQLSSILSCGIEFVALIIYVVRMSTLMSELEKRIAQLSSLYGGICGPVSDVGYLTEWIAIIVEWATSGIPKSYPGHSGTLLVSVRELHYITSCRNVYS